MKKSKLSELKTPGVFPSRAALYHKIASKHDKILKRLLELLESKNESIALGAANTLMGKILPDLKATELTGENSGPVLVRIVQDNGANQFTNQELPKTAGNL